MRLTSLLLFAAAVAFTGCVSTTQPAPEESKVTLKLAVTDIYCRESACSCVHDVAARSYVDVQAQLLEQYGIDLQLDYFEDPYGLEKELLAQRYDGFICKPWITMRLGSKAGRRFERVADILDPKNNRWLSALVVVLADSEVQELSDLNGKCIVIGETDAYEKYYDAKELFSRKKLTFSEIRQTASCIENLGKLMDGLVDAAVVSDYALLAGCAVDFAEPEDFRILGRTENIPLTSVSLDTRRVPAEERKRVRDALLSLSKNGAPESMLSRGFVKPAKWLPEEAAEH